MAGNPEPRHFTPSGKENPGFANDAARTFTAGAFTFGSHEYHDVRPTYPRDVAELIAEADSLIDVGAGTGKLTSTLVRPGRFVGALDPSISMLSVLRSRHPGIPVWRATAEATGVADSCVDAYVSAQTWHWVDTAAASAEADRVVKPGGALMLCWNTLDVSHPWVLRLSRISHSGDVHREGFYPSVDAPWRLERELRTRWFEAVTPEHLFALARTRAYWLRANEATRQKVTENLNWYLYDRLGFDPGQPIPLPYRTDAFLYRRTREN